MTSLTKNYILVLFLLSLAWQGNAQTGASDSMEFRLQLPIGGLEGRDWIINYYVDLDPSSGIRDYRGGHHTYNGHKGTDFLVPSFLWMENDFPILAAAHGRVIRFHDREFDQHISRTPTCSLQWNFVEIEHSNGYRSTYGHLKKNSVVVEVGDHVIAGQKIGVVGSSGCSSQPHLDFELRNQDGVIVDPFRDQLWENAPSYEKPASLMSYVIKKGMIEGWEDIFFASEEVASMNSGDIVGIGATVFGVEPGDAVTFIAQNGSTIYAEEVEVSSDRFVSTWAYNYSLRKPGTWTIRVAINGQDMGMDHSIRVR